MQIALDNKRRSLLGFCGAPLIGTQSTKLTIPRCLAIFDASVKTFPAFQDRNDDRFLMWPA